MEAPQFSDQREFSVPMAARAAYEKAVDVVYRCGFINKQDNDRLRLIGGIRSGFLGLNPARVTIDVSSGDANSSTVRIEAYAVEGWIPQRSAPKAVEKFVAEMTA